jgi:hypothetical protein
MRDTEFLYNLIRCDLDTDKSLERRLREIWIRRVPCRLHEGGWQEEEIFFLIPDERLRIPECIGRGTHIPEEERAFLFWVFDITYIIEVDLDTTILCTTPLVYLGIISDTDQTIRVIRMEIGRVAWDLQFSEDSWFARVSE